jgi:hypothetical protein
MPAGQPKIFGTPEELQEKVDAYFDRDNEGAWYTNEEGQKVYAPTMAGLARFLEVDRKTVTNYAHRDEYFPTIKKARSRVEEFLERRLYGTAVTGVIFNLKNNFDWKDKNEVDHTSSDGTMTQPTTIKLIAPE